MYRKVMEKQTMKEDINEKYHRTFALAENKLR